ncbi:hypothetical protein VNO80_00407 [Phaseolus coccineus]|uniref:Germin-like protein n=1 Tax=Phaseolus coccineus TaxID=3886 RepID=A0AAN9RQU1_PHACN
MNTILILFFCALVSSTSHAGNLQEFCVADLKDSDSPSGYHCKPPNTVTAADFKHTFGPGIPAPTKSTLYPATVVQVPALNGLGISAGRVEIEKGGSLPLHTHAANEILIMHQGEMTVGLLTPTRAYVNKLKPGDLTVFPDGLQHYLVNSGNEKAVAFATYSSPNPRIDFLYQILFANNVSANTIAQTTFLDEPQVRKLQARFNGGS